MGLDNASPLKKARTRSTNNAAAAITPDHCTPIAAKKKGQSKHQWIRLVPQKPTSKYLSEMNSPSSILAAVGNYNSIRDALQSDTDGISTKTKRPSSKKFRRTINKHFGECAKFQEEFKSNLDKSTSPYFATKVKKKYSYSEVEKAFHESVRHECDKACFLRAYGPIREYCFVWRDLCFRKPGACGPTKSQLLDGWRCQLAQPQAETTSPVSPEDADSIPDGKIYVARKAKSSSICPTIFVSSNGEEFDKKAKLIKRLNDQYINAPGSFLSASADPSPHTNYMGEIVTSINPLFSPLGLLEELFINDPWKLLLSTHFLNKTQRNAVDPILFKFLQLWPNPELASSASADEIFIVISVLGLGDKRSRGVVRFSKEYLQLIADKRDRLESFSTEKINSNCDASPVEFHLSEKEVMSLHQCGKYAWTAYKLFILKQLPEECDTFDVCDHALQLYTEYKLGVVLTSTKTKENSLVHSSASTKKTAPSIFGEASSTEQTSPVQKGRAEKPKSSSERKSTPKSSKSAGALVSCIEHPQPKQSPLKTQIEENELDTKVSGKSSSTKKRGKRPPFLIEKHAHIQAEQVDDLPHGWVRRRFLRRNGKQNDVKIYTPQMNIALRSKVEARRLLAKLDEAGGDEVMAWHLIQCEKGAVTNAAESTDKKKKRKNATTRGADACTENSLPSKKKRKNKKQG